MYERLAAFAQSWGLLLFVLAFVLVLIYALLPSNRETFRKAARLPLGDDERPGDPQDETHDRGDRTR
ncbi:MAG: cbb3-type cytochrome c oxidase subunit 3 [Alphaproteobacteria bacterium]|nr:cbb3-type cytochrome c oxidase subunit 3 [Alphaproteobacteria bacterium]